MNKIIIGFGLAALLVGCQKSGNETAEQSKVSAEEGSPVVSVPLVTASSSPALGKISYDDASALYNELQRPVDDADQFGQKAPHERVAYLQEARDFEARYDVFGESSQCRIAAKFRTQYIESLNLMARISEMSPRAREWQELTLPLHLAFAFGNSVGGCFDEVEALDTRPIKK